MGEDSETAKPKPSAAIAAGIRVVWQLSPRAVVALGVLAIARGLVPPAATVLTGQAVAAATSPGLATGSHDLGVALVALAVLYGVEQVVDTLLFPVEEAWALRLNGRVEQRTVRALLDPPLLDHLLDPEVQRLADTASRQEWPNTGPFANACFRMVTWLIGALAQATLVAVVFSPVLAIGVVAGWLAVGRWVRTRELRAALSGFNRVRRPHYYRRLALEHRSAGEVRAFGLSGWLIDRFDQGWREGMAVQWAERATSGRRLIGLLALVVSGNVAALTVVAVAADHGRLDAREVAMVATALIALTGLALPQFWDDPLLRGATRLPALLELEQIAAAETARVVPVPPRSCAELPAEAIRFEGVSFAYPGRDHPVLDDLHLTIEAGRSLAIVGLNGAGKTTLVKLLARLHDPTAGRITIDGIDLRELDPTAWHQRVAAIFQDFLRYPLPAIDNVTLAPPGARIDESILHQAVDAAGAGELVAGLRHGWDTRLSRRYAEGADLSGGQWQRIALARAIYALRSGAGVLVLDEPTANLDARGEAELFDRFLEVAEGTSTVLISHRFSTVRRADRIVVLAAGRVVEEGSHDQLVELGGEYARLFELQARRYRGTPTATASSTGGTDLSEGAP